MNKRIVCLGAALIPGLLLTVALSAQSTGASGAPVRPAAKVTPKAPAANDLTAERALVAKYCAGCHNQKLKSGGLSLEGIDIAHLGEHAEIGEKMVRKVRAGMMPPSGLPRPDAATYEAFAGALERQLDLAAAAKPVLAPPGAHRLNRKEYANAVRELTALEVDPSGLLPVDDASYGFDNMAGTLGTSPALIEAYVSAAAKISRLALGQEMALSRKNYLAPPDYSQNHRAEGLAFGTRGGMLVRHYFPADGEYELDWTPVRANAGGLFGNTVGEQLEMTVDGARVKLYDVDKDIPKGGGTDADHHAVKVSVKAGMRSVGLAFVNTTDVPSDDLNKHFERTTLTQNLGGFTFALHVNSLSVTGPYNPTRPEHTASRDRILVCHPANAAEETPCAKTILSALARKAYRRPVGERDVETLLSLYQAGRNDGTFDDGIRRGLQLILSDPEFIYRTEAVPAGVKVGQPYRVSERELASRLSFFLWSSPPDDELLQLAVQGKLRAPGVLAQQVRRMLADPRSHELISNFGGQWLQLRNLQAVSPVADLYPDFDDNLRQAFKTETELFFESIVREDRNVVDLLNADYTFVNERLAKHYGIPNIYGAQFRRIHLGEEFDVRRGLLGQGSILTVSSVADRTSPVLRGKWVMLNILGVIPPDPPPNVPPLKTDDQGASQGPVSIRERMEKHRANQPCASCHRMMDPIGFAMENFDGIGRYRTTEGGAKLDLSGQLVDGSKFAGTAELRRELMRYAPQFVHTMTERLLTYALGRGVEYTDMPVVRKVMKDAAAKNNRFSALVLGIVESQPFQMNQAVGENIASK